MKSTNHHSRPILAGVALTLALVGAAATAQEGPMTMAMAPGPMMMGGPGGHGGHGGPGGPGGEMMDRMLDRVNATPEQRAQVRQILQTQREEMRAQRQAGQALRSEMMALLTAPTVDAAAVEQLRQKQLAMHDAASKRMSQSMIEISRVLTPEQRKQLGEYMAQRQQMMQRHMRERQSLEPPPKG